MTPPTAELMREATRLTRAGRLAEATALLRGLPRAPRPDAPPRHARPEARILDADPHTGEVATPRRGGGFEAHGFRGPAGRLEYWLYVPSSGHHRPMPLILMLHGCTQTPQDFALGTGMNHLAEAHGCLVAYPAQPRSANAQRCWNWFSPEHQRRGQGEPALIAGLTREVMATHRVDEHRVFVAGLSAGGAAAAIMAAAYPELYAAVGVHSGLACGAAHDVPSAFAAMRQGGGRARRKAQAGRAVPMIVFHGDQDATVHPANADDIIAMSAPNQRLSRESQSGGVPGGHAWRRTIHRDAAGHTLLEQWLVQGAGHAWSGGNAAASYTDARGPDASREMLRFFLEHPMPGAEG